MFLLYIYEPSCEKSGLRGFPIRSVTNQVVLQQKIARGHARIDEICTIQSRRTQRHK